MRPLRSLSRSPLSEGHECNAARGIPSPRLCEIDRCRSMNSLRKSGPRQEAFSLPRQRRRMEIWLLRRLVSKMLYFAHKAFFRACSLRQWTRRLRHHPAIPRISDTDEAMCGHCP